jgi:hypothetical protein
MMNGSLAKSRFAGGGAILSGSGSAMRGSARPRRRLLHSMCVRI